MIKQFILFLILLLPVSINYLTAQQGYYDAPYIRYEADSATLTNGSIVTPKSYSQPDLQSEASNQICVDMSSEGASAEFTFLESADGMVIRFSVPDGDSAVIGVYNGDIRITSLTLTSKWSWEYLWSNGDPNNNGITNYNPRMRFDEVRYKLSEKLSNIKLVKESGDLWIDFIEMEKVPDKITAPAGSAIFNGDGSELQAFIDSNGGKTIFLPEGIYNINSQLYFGVNNTKLMGAGMWYTQLNFTKTDESNGGLRANALNVSYSDLFITTEMTTRTNGYAGILGVYTQGSTIRNIWVEHCATGAWIAQYVNGGPEYADGFIMSNCRFRNTYADGINLCKGTRNAIVEHCNFRNNGDDAQAIWSAEGLECINNTFRFNTVENGWRAAGAALYGGKDNKFYSIIIKDNIDIGITVTNFFQGVGFNDNGMHDFHDITLIACGTFNATYNDRVGAINIYHASGAGTEVKNIKMYDIDIIDSKCDAIRLSKRSGTGILNLRFENININGTGMEYPHNNPKNYTSSRGHAVYFDSFPIGNATYCGLKYSNLGGNSNGTAFNTNQKGSFTWTELTDCDPVSVTGLSLSPADTSVAGGTTLQIFPNFSPANSTNQTINYISGNPEIAIVNSAGLVTCLSQGTATITGTTLDGNFTASSIITVTNAPIVCYKIKNRWQNTYLYDGGDRVKYSTTANGNSYLWQIEDIEGVNRIKNYSTGDYMHIKDLLGYVQCTFSETEELSSKWSVEDTGTGFIRIKSEMDTINYIHIENLQNQAQYGPVESSWWSAMWALELVNLTTSVNNFQINNIAKIFPNPSNGNFTLSISNFILGETVTVFIYNINGQVKYTNSLTVNKSGTMQIKLNAGNILTPGNYYLLAKGDSKSVRTKLIITR